MNVKYEGNKAILEGNVFEDEVLGLRKYINDNGSNKISFDLSKCNDMHMAVVQLLISCKALFECEFIFADRTKPYAMAIAGFKVD